MCIRDSDRGVNPVTATSPPAPTPHATLVELLPCPSWKGGRSTALRLPAVGPGRTHVHDQRTNCAHSEGPPAPFAADDGCPTKPAEASVALGRPFVLVAVLD